jgi:FHS family L-fucose permease-like MFS transporter
MKIVKTKDGRSYLLPFILVTSLFFLWGFAHSILDVLNKDFQIVFEMTKAKSALVQMMVYGGYFLMALPAGYFIKKYGYRKGVILGLLLYALGAFLFIPGSMIESFPFFLVCLFIIGCGLTCLETAANPYITVLGEPKYGSSRLNFAQAFNGFGWICGPLVGSLVILSDSHNISNLSIPYMAIGIAVLIIAVLFICVKLPEIKEDEEEKDEQIATNNVRKSLWAYPHFIFGLVALFFYVAAQTGINSFFINYASESTIGFSPKEAGLLLSFGGMGLFMVGRFIGSWLLSMIRAGQLLFLFAIGALICMILVTLNMGWISLVALFTCYFFESIMFPTIFSMSLRDLGEHTKQASSFLVMSIVGGAIAPWLMGIIGEESMSIGFCIPLICFIIIAIFAAWYNKLKLEIR